MSKSDASEIFARYSPFIRDFIYKNNWQSLREVQLRAADVIFNSENNLLISSSTASGKTEAAFFPILSMLESEGRDSFGVLYIAPLKALINDQFSRLEYLLDESDIPVFHWHGDVPTAHKEKWIKKPCGILQITPESLESMLINRRNDIPRIFGNLRFVIIDEIHTLMGFDRGGQTKCIIERISSLIGFSPRRIGLSATVGDTSLAAKWLGEGSGRDTEVVDIKEKGIVWKLAVQHFFADGAPGPQTEPKNSEEAVEMLSGSFETTDSSQEAPPADAASEFVYDATARKKCIIFSNSREETEHVTATMRQIAEKRGDPDRFYIHHGNLSAAIREETEIVLKSDAINTACATVTLELGIDIGKLERIINIGSPNTVTGFLQRIGRSGRRSEPSEMILVFREEPILPNAPLYQLIPWELLQAIAIIQLYIEERWIEPPFSKAMPMSLLFHQTLSAAVSSGSLSPAKLAGRVLSLSPFRNVDKNDYRDLLVDMIKRGYLQQTEEKELICGEKGERLAGNFKFYAVFKDSEDYTVRIGSEEIGTITSVPPVGDRFALAGHVWEVEEIDVPRKLIYVKRVKGKMEISWPGDKGEIHTKILKRMKRVIEEDIIYPYLMPNAAKRLNDVRQLNKNTRFTECGIIPLVNMSYVMFPWLGTRSVRTFRRFLKFKCASKLGLTQIEQDSCYYLTYKAENCSPRELALFMKNYIDRNEIRMSELVGENEHPIYEKYDDFISQKLLLKSFYTDKLDFTESKERINEIDAETRKQQAAFQQQK